MKHTQNIKFARWWIYLLLSSWLASCDPYYYDNLEIYNGTPNPITVVLGKDMGAFDSIAIRNFVEKTGCGDNIQHLGNNFYITGCPIQPGERFGLHSFFYLGHKSIDITDTNKFRTYALPSIFDSLYLEDDSLLKNPKLPQNWPYEVNKQVTTFTFSILPEDIQ